MPLYAYLRTDLECPVCGTILTDMVWFQWGYCPGYAPREEYIYHLGDAIYWRPCADTTIHPWISFEEGGGNVGDPVFKNLIVRDSAQYFLNAPCRHCHTQLGGAAIEVRDGKIVTAWICKPGELASEGEIYAVEETGELKPMPEWDDHPLPLIHDC